MTIATEGDTSTTITCTATSVPVPTIIWIRSDGSSLVSSRYNISDTTHEPLLVNEGSNEVFQVTGYLTIVNVVREDTGVYSCIVMNVVNKVRSYTTLTVLCK